MCSSTRETSADQTGFILHSALWFCSQLIIWNNWFLCLLWSFLLWYVEAVAHLSLTCLLVCVSSFMFAGHHQSSCCSAWRAAPGSGLTGEGMFWCRFMWDNKTIHHALLHALTVVSLSWESPQTEWERCLITGWCWSLMTCSVGTSYMWAVQIYIHMWSRTTKQD